MMLTSLWAKDQNYLKHGALVGPRGQVFLVEDNIMVRVKYPEIMEVPNKLNTIIGQLSSTIDNMHNIPTNKMTNANTWKENNDDHSDLKSLLMNKLLIVNDTLNNALEDFHLSQTQTEPQVTRKRRGLFNAIGYLARSLFGTAMNSDVKSLRQGYNNVITWVMKTNKVINIHNKDLMTLDTNVNKLRNYTDMLTNSINNLISNVDEIFSITETS